MIYKVENVQKAFPAEGTILVLAKRTINVTYLTSPKPYTLCECESSMKNTLSPAFYSAVEVVFRGLSLGVYLEKSLVVLPGSKSQGFSVTSSSRWQFGDTLFIFTL